MNLSNFAKLENLSNEQLLIAFIIVLACVALLMALAFTLRKRARGAALEGSEGFDRIGGIANRIEKVERSVVTHQTELAREIEALQCDVAFIKDELAAVRESLGTASHAVVTPQEELPMAEPPVHREDPHEQPPLETSADTQPMKVLLPDEAAGESSSLASRLVKTRTGFLSKIRQLFSSKPHIDAGLIDELEAQLIGSDLGVSTVQALITQVKEELAKGREIDRAALEHALKTKLISILAAGAPADASITPTRRSSGPLIVMMVGVNGVGKTTTTAKLASMWKDKGAKVLMVAADTFRAAAVDQLLEWGSRIGVPVITGVSDAKPSTVVFDAMKRAEHVDVILIDTAGRLHNKSNLMQELQGIKNIVQRTQPDAPHETILVVDGTTGGNALSQAREFHQVTPLSGLVVTKLDGTSKGGVVVAIKSELGIPVRYIGVGESQADLRVFSPSEFVGALFDDSGIVAEDVAPSAHGEERRKRRRPSSLAAEIRAAIE